MSSWQVDALIRMLTSKCNDGIKECHEDDFKP
jgi:hypothetical protein